MGQALHPVQLVQVVGQHAGGKAALAQRGQYVDVVVDPAQQHRLVEQLRTGAAQACQRGIDAGVELVGVVGMDHEGQRPGQAGQPVHEFVVHAFGQHHRQPAVDAQAAHVGDRGQRRGQLRQLGGGQRQRVAAGQDHLVDRRVGGNGRQRLFPGAAGGVFPGIVEMAAETIAAVDRAAAGGHQQGAPAVLLDHAGGLLRRAVADRVEAEPRNHPHLGIDRQHLPQQRVGRVARTHARGKAARYPQRELRQRLRRHAQVGGFQSQPGQQLGRVTDRLPPMRLPAAGGQGGGGFLWSGGEGCGYHGRPEKQMPAFDGGRSILIRPPRARRFCHLSGVPAWPATA